MAKQYFNDYPAHQEDIDEERRHEEKDNVKATDNNRDDKTRKETKHRLSWRECH